MIFVCEDNGYAEATAAEYAVGGTQTKRAEGFGIPSVQVDGNDFFAVYDAARDAIQRARDGGGPFLLHLRLGRYYGHFEGDATTYRARGEVEALRDASDCLKRFRKQVTEASLLEGHELDTVDAEVAKLIDDAVAHAKAAPLPSEEDLLSDVYVSY